MRNGNQAMAGPVHRICWTVTGVGVLIAASTIDSFGRPATQPSQTASAPAGAANTLVVAAVSIESKKCDVAHNLERIEHWSRQAASAGAELVCFPELALSSWWASREIRQHAEPVDGPSIQHLIRLAGELKIMISVGMTEMADDGVHITQVLLNGRGVIGRHRKTDLASGEEKVWDPGNDANVFDIGKAKIGIAICYESIHPQTCAALKARGAEIILAPYANGTKIVELHTGKRPYTYARATENRVWYVACDGTGPESDGTMRAGATYVISPDGKLVAFTPKDATGENMVVYSIPLNKRE